MLKKMILLLGLIGLFITSLSYANEQAMPTCGSFKHKGVILTAFYFPKDHLITFKNLNPYKNSIKHLDVLNFSVAEISKNDLLKSSYIIDQNLLTIQKWLKVNRIKTRIFLSVGHWYVKPSFKILLNQRIRTRFIQSLIHFVKQRQYGISGLDIDYENVLSPDTRTGLYKFPIFIKQLRLALNKQGLKNTCLSLDLPASTKYALLYPNPHTWAPYVNWANLMAYAYYGGAPHYTELDGALGTVQAPYSGERSDNPTVSIIKSLHYYTIHGLPKRKLLIGLPFYADMNYTRFTGKFHQYGLRQKVADDRSIIVIPYRALWKDYGTLTHPKGKAQFYHYTFQAPKSIKGDKAYWIIYPVTHSSRLGSISMYISYEDPKAVTAIAKYVKQKDYLGFSAWQLGDDLPFSNKNSLLRNLYFASR